MFNLVGSPMSQNKLGLITHCDINYLSRALALINSLRENGESAQIHVLCHDLLSLEKLNELQLLGVNGISRSTMFQYFPELIEAEKTRNSLEFFYLFSPYLLKYLERLGYEQLVYLDADLYFFDSLESTIKLTDEYDVGIIPHRFEPRDSHLNKYGIYNVGLVYFKTNNKALKTLNWWAESCMRSTKFEITESAFGDQKYLDYFHLMGAKIFTNYSHGHNAAPWNCNSVEVTKLGEISVKGEKLFFYHFSGLKIYKKFATLGFTPFRKKPNRAMRRRIYKRYIQVVVSWEKIIDNPNYKNQRSLQILEIVHLIRHKDYVIN